MTNVVRNGLKQELTFKGALHLSLSDMKATGTDKLVVNTNKTGNGTWVDFICLYGFVDGPTEVFRIGGVVMSTLEGHQDLHKWLDICLEELNWEGSIGLLDKDQIILEIFNFINEVSNVIMTDDTVNRLRNEEGLGIMTYYPWPEDYDGPEEEEVDEEIEEVVEEITEEDGEEEYTGINKPVNPEEVIQFLDYKLEKIEDGGLGCKSPNFVFSYSNDEIYSKVDIFVEKDSEGNPHITKADLFQKGFAGTRDKTKSIAEGKDLQDFSDRKKEFEDRIMKASGIYLVTSEAFYRDRLSKDLSTLVQKLLEGMEWKENLTSVPSATAIDEDEDDLY